MSVNPNPHQPDVWQTKTKEAHIRCPKHSIFTVSKGSASIRLMQSSMCVFNDSVVSNSTWPHGLQLTRLLHPSLSPRVCSNSCLLSCWRHPTISSSVELHSMQPNSEKTIWSLSKLCFLLPPSCYNYSVFDQMANNFWSQTRCSRSSVNLQADDGGETNLKAVTATQHCFHEDWPQKKKKKKKERKNGCILEMRLK